MLRPALLILLCPNVYFASDQFLGNRKSIIGSEGGCETIGGSKKITQFINIDQYFQVTNVCFLSPTRFMSLNLQSLSQRYGPILKGRMYFACTGDDSDNGAPWCAVQVTG